FRSERTFLSAGISNGLDRSSRTYPQASSRRVRCRRSGMERPQNGLWPISKRFFHEESPHDSLFAGTREAHALHNRSMSRDAKGLFCSQGWTWRSLKSMRTVKHLQLNFLLLSEFSASRK